MVICCGSLRTLTQTSWQLSSCHVPGTAVTGVYKLSHLVHRMILVTFRGSSCTDSNHWGTACLPSRGMLARESYLLCLLNVVPSAAWQSLKGTNCQGWRADLWGVLPVQGRFLPIPDSLGSPSLGCHHSSLTATGSSNDSIYNIPGWTLISRLAFLSHCTPWNLGILEHLWSKDPEVLKIEIQGMPVLFWLKVIWLGPLSYW